MEIEFQSFHVQVSLFLAKSSDVRISSKETSCNGIFKRSVSQA